LTLKERDLARRSPSRSENTLEFAAKVEKEGLTLLTITRILWTNQHIQQPLLKSFSWISKYIRSILCL